MAFKITNKGLYWGLIVTFGLLYALVAFVSTLHAIDFFKLANITSLAVLLGIAYEVGQATVLFSILMTKNKEKFLPWLLMFLLTGLQVTANVYASFKHMSLSGNEDWTYWYTSILKIFGVQGGSAETYQVIISWISGALLPIVALGMTALVAQNIKLITEEDNPDSDEDLLDVGVDEQKFTPVSEEDRVKSVEELTDVADETKGALATEEIEKIRKLMDTDPIKNGAISDNIKKVLSPGLPLEDDAGNSPREQISKEVNDNVHMDDVPFPVEDHIVQENKELKDFVENVFPVDEEMSAEESVITPMPTSDDMGEMIEPLGDTSEPKDIGEVLTDLVERVKEETPPSIDVPTVVDVEPTPPVKYESDDPPEEKVETEEEKQERLREVAREKLKKK